MKTSMPASRPLPSLVSPPMNFDTGVHSTHTKPASVVKAAFKPGVGTAGSTVTVTWTSRDSAHQLVSEAHLRGRNLTLRIGDYRDPGKKGVPGAKSRTTNLDVPFAPAGTKLKVINKDGKVILTGVIPEQHRFGTTIKVPGR